MKLRYFYKVDRAHKPVPFSNLKRGFKPIGKRWRELIKPCCDPVAVSCTCDFRYFIQLDAQGQPVDATLIKRKHWPEMSDNIRYMELPWNECCVVPESIVVPEQPVGFKIIMAGVNSCNNVVLHISKDGSPVVDIDLTPYANGDNSIYDVTAINLQSGSYYAYIGDTDCFPSQFNFDIAENTESVDLSQYGAFVHQKVNPSLFDVTADWVGAGVTDAPSFITALSTLDLTDITVTSFSLVGNRLTAQFGANLSATNSTKTFRIRDIVASISDVQAIGNIADLEVLRLDGRLSSNLITDFDPAVALPAGLKYLNLAANQITSFDPTLPLPSTLEILKLGPNLMTDFNPTLALPSGLKELRIGDNPIGAINPTIPFPAGLQILGFRQTAVTNWSLMTPFANNALAGNCIMDVSNNAVSAAGAAFIGILTAKGWTVNV